MIVLSDDRKVTCIITNRRVPVALCVRCNSFAGFYDQEHTKMGCYAEEAIRSYPKQLKISVNPEFVEWQEGFMRGYIGLRERDYYRLKSGLKSIKLL